MLFHFGGNTAAQLGESTSSQEKSMTTDQGTPNHHPAAPPRLLKRISHLTTGMNGSLTVVLHLSFSRL